MLSAAVALVHMPPESLCMCRSPNILLTEGPSHKRRAKLGDVGLARTLQTPPTVSDALQVCLGGGCVHANSARV